MRWLAGSSPVAERIEIPGLVAYYWNGSAPVPHRVGNISTSGLYLFTEERWCLDTVLLMSLQRTTIKKNDPRDRFSVLSRVVRLDGDGVGLQFVASDSVGQVGGQVLPGKGLDKQALEKFLLRLNRAE